MPLRLASADRGMTAARCTALGHAYGLIFVGLQVRASVCVCVHAARLGVRHVGL